MCGIAGLLRFAPGEGGQPPLQDSLRRMAARMAHRGPDGEAFWVSGDAAVGLAHRRLAIVDLSPSAAQPMRLADADLTVSYNGEIYNHMALRRELEHGGARFVTDHADTEVLLHGYLAWGLNGLLQRLDGMFAFALWDGRQGLLHLARDRVGVKPLYFASRPGEFRFASEIKALLAIDRPVFDAAAFRLYLTFMAAPAPQTLFQGIHKLPAGHHVTLRACDGSCRIARYWNLPVKGVEIEASAIATDWPGKLRQLLEAAVSKRLMGDVPAGLLLSGGVDSSAIAAIAMQQAGNRLDSFTIGFETPTLLDESDHARATALRLGTRHHEMRIGANDVPALLEQAAWHQDEPLADWVCLPLLALCGLIRDTGIKMVLSGEGADEVFAGYAGYLAQVRFERQYGACLRRLPRPLLQLAAMLAGIGGGTWPRLAAMQAPFRALGQGEPVFMGGAVAWSLADIARLLPPATATPVLPPEWSVDRHMDAVSLVRGFEQEFTQAGGADALDRIQHLEFRQRLPELLLMRLDKMAMAHGVEAREPFLDRDVIDFAQTLPSRALIADMQPKAMLKQALRGLVPDALLDRPKVGFGAPVAEWLRGPLGDDLLAALIEGPLVVDQGLNQGYIRTMMAEHRAGRDHAVRLWTLINADVWHRQWFGIQAGPTESQRS